MLATLISGAGHACPALPLGVVRLAEGSVETLYATVAVKPDFPEDVRSVNEAIYDAEILASAALRDDPRIKNFAGGRLRGVATESCVSGDTVYATSFISAETLAAAEEAHRAIRNSIRRQPSGRSLGPR